MKKDSDMPLDKVASSARDNQIDETTGRSGKVIVVVFVTLAIGVALYFALGMPGMDHGLGSTMNRHGHELGDADSSAGRSLRVRSWSSSLARW